jgi:hypothetical protein
MMVFGYIIVMFIYLEHVDSAYQKYHTHSIPVHSVKPSLTVVRAHLITIYLSHSS